MENRENIKVTTTTSAKDMFRFQIYQVYLGYMGFLLGLLSVMALVDLIGNFTSMSAATKVFCMVLLAWVLILNPLFLYYRSRKQVESMELDRIPMEMEIGRDGIRLSQGEGEGFIPWKEITRIVILKQMVIFYMGRSQVHLLPFREIQGQAGEVADAVRAYGTGIKIVDKRKKKRRKK